MTIAETGAADEVPRLVPVRMVNEAAYCPRLFFLEWVQARWSDSADTVEGRFVHRVVDRESGTVPAPDVGDVEAPRAARSVTLSSEELGLVGKADLLEIDGGSVSPVDYKRGSPPANPERSWEPERVQLCALGLLLRADGYTCDHGTLWFAGSRERVEVPFSEQLVGRTLEVIAGLRELARRDLPPPPLIDSPKCPRCSLVGICLPDEHNVLLARSSLPPRRMVPSASAARPLYVTEAGSVVGARAGRIEVTRKGERLASVRAIDVSQLSVFGNVQVTTQALRHCFATETPVCFLSSGGWLQGMASGLPSKHSDLRRRQVAVAGSGGLELARCFVEGKIRNARTLLRRNGRPAPPEVLAALAEATTRARQVESFPSLLGVEGAAARSYFSAFPTMLKSELSLPGQPFSFAGRNRRPPRDAINCLLSFVYSLLVKDLVAVSLAVGFDPYLGFYHRPRFGRPALALDLAEEMRALLGDSVVVNLVNNGEIRPAHFTVRGQAVALSADGRRSVLSAWERRLDTELTHPVFGYKVSYRRAMEVQARLLGAALLGEVPHYTPLTTR